MSRNCWVCPWCPCLTCGAPPEQHPISRPRFSRKADPPLVGHDVHDFDPGFSIAWAAVRIGRGPHLDPAAGWIGVDADYPLLLAGPHIEALHPELLYGDILPGHLINRALAAMNVELPAGLMKAIHDGKIGG